MNSEKNYLTEEAKGQRDHVCEYDWKAMKIKDLKTGNILPMRIDTEGGMVEIWYHSESHWVWCELATEAFKKHLFSQNTGLKPKFE
ncbi:MAG: hypothetical protein GY909_15675 [Oligoflexia bacterium]|nr:hypothetical protein [Oligoflexia bacterium]